MGSPGFPGGRVGPRTSINSLAIRPGVDLSGFAFGYRSTSFDFRLLHGFDCDAVVRLTDVRAVEECLETLQRGSVEAERGLTTRNCVQLFRMLQLAIEYLAHLRNVHITLLEHYKATTAAAERWQAAAHAYLESGHAFINECIATALVSPSAIADMDSAKAGLEQQDEQYNKVLDQLEAEDSRARHFHFRRQRSELNWRALHGVDVDELVHAASHLQQQHSGMTAASSGLEPLEAVLHNLTYGSILGEDVVSLTTTHWTHLIPLAQCALDYMMFQQAATGSALEAAMTALQSACADIPPLTTATQELHAQLTAFLLEAQGQQEEQRHQQHQQHSLQLSQASPQQLYEPHAPLPQPAARAHGHHQQQQSYLGTDSFGKRIASMPSEGLHPSSSTVLLGSMPLGNTAGHLGITGSNNSPPLQQQQHSQTSGSQYLDYHGTSPPQHSQQQHELRQLHYPRGQHLQARKLGGAAAQAESASARAALNLLPFDGHDVGPLLGLHTHAAGLQLQVETLEQDLRLERHKTEEMRQLLSDMKARLTGPISSQPSHLHQQIYPQPALAIDTASAASSQPVSFDSGIAFVEHKSLGGRTSPSRAFKHSHSMSAMPASTVQSTQAPAVTQHNIATAIPTVAGSTQPSLAAAILGSCQGPPISAALGGKSNSIAHVDSYVVHPRSSGDGRARIAGMQHWAPPQPRSNITSAQPLAGVQLPTDASAIRMAEQKRVVNLLSQKVDELKAQALADREKRTSGAGTDQAGMRGGMHDGMQRSSSRSREPSGGGAGAFLASDAASDSNNEPCTLPPAGTVGADHVFSRPHARKPSIENERRRLSPEPSYSNIRPDNAQLAAPRSARTSLNGIEGVGLPPRQPNVLLPPRAPQHHAHSSSPPAVRDSSSLQEAQTSEALPTPQVYGRAVLPVQLEQPHNQQGMHLTLAASPAAAASDGSPSLADPTPFDPARRASPTQVQALQAAAAAVLAVESGMGSGKLPHSAQQQQPQQQQPSELPRVSERHVQQQEQLQQLQRQLDAMSRPAARPRSIGGAPIPATFEAQQAQQRAGPRDAQPASDTDGGFHGQSLPAAVASMVPVPTQIVDLNSSMRKHAESVAAAQAESLVAFAR